MGKIVLIAVSIFALAAMYYSYNGERNLNDANAQLARQEHEVLARHASLTGLDLVRQKLAEDFRSYRDITGEHDGGSYEVDAIVTGTDAVVVSQGTAHLSDNTTADYNVRVTFRKVDVIPPKAPPFMRYAAVSDQNIELSGNIETDVYSENELNASIHTNGSLRVNGMGAEIRGFGTFSGGVSPSLAFVSSSFEPNYNPSGADPVFETERVDIPPMDAGSLAAGTVVDSTTAGDVVLAGNYDFGRSREDPYVWHITGDLLVDHGGTTLSGYVIFLLEGNAEIGGNVEIGGVSSDGGDESSIALYVNGNVTTTGSPEIWGQIYTNGDVTFMAGTPTIYGNITTNGTLDFRGTVNIYYRLASPALTRQFQDDLTILQRISYSEW